MSIHDLLDLLVPDHCEVCDAPAAPGTPGWCVDCLAAVPRLAPDEVLAVTPYDGPVRDLIVRWKSRPEPRLSRPLVSLMGHALPDLLGDAGGDLVVPVPQGTAAWIRRGFSPANDLAWGVARQLGVPLSHPLRRLVGGRRQQGLTAVQRARNVGRQFRARPSPGLAGRTVVLTDDVVTTAATINACCGALRGAGARAVIAVVLARAERAPSG